MANLRYNLVSMDGASTLTVFHDRPLVATDSHPFWKQILEGVVQNDDADALRYFDIKEEVRIKFARLSERVTVVDGNVCFDGDSVDTALTKQILRFLDEGVDDWQPLVNFFEKVMLNPTEHSREQLFGFLQHNDFAINDDGDIVGYKGVTGSDKEGFAYRSVHSGTNTVYVNDEPQTGYVYQNVGDTVEMPRADVNHDPSQGCSQGLHVSTYNYATSYASGGGMLQVFVNPRDVVSVPDDGGWEKVRVSRYVIEKVVTEPYRSAVYNAYAPPAIYAAYDDEDSWYDSWDDEDGSW